MTQYKDIDVKDCKRYGMTLLQFMLVLGVAGVIVALLVKLLV